MSAFRMLGLASLPCILDALGRRMDSEMTEELKTRMRERRRRGDCSGGSKQQGRERNGGRNRDSGH